MSSRSSSCTAGAPRISPRRHRRRSRRASSCLRRGQPPTHRAASSSSLSTTSISTTYGIMGNLEQVLTRRKAFIYVSNVYDFNPFADTRLKNDQKRAQELNGGNSSSDGSSSDNSNQSQDDVNPFGKQGNEFADA